MNNKDEYLIQARVIRTTLTEIIYDIENDEDPVKIRGLLAYAGLKVQKLMEQFPEAPQHEHLKDG